MADAPKRNITDITQIIGETLKTQLPDAAATQFQQAIQGAFEATLETDTTLQISDSDIQDLTSTIADEYTKSDTHALSDQRALVSSITSVTLSCSTIELNGEIIDDKTLSSKLETHVNDLKEIIVAEVGVANDYKTAPEIAIIANADLTKTIGATEADKVGQQLSGALNAAFDTNTTIEITPEQITTITTAAATTYNAATDKNPAAKNTLLNNAVSQIIDNAQTIRTSGTDVTDRSSLKAATKTYVDDIFAPAPPPVVAPTKVKLSEVLKTVNAKLDALVKTEVYKDTSPAAIKTLKDNVKAALTKVAKESDELEIQNYEANMAAGIQSAITALRDPNNGALELQTNATGILLSTVTTNTTSVAEKPFNHTTDITQDARNSITVVIKAHAVENHKGKASVRRELTSALALYNQKQTKDENKASLDIDALMDLLPDNISITGDIQKQQARIKKGVQEFNKNKSGPLGSKAAEIIIAMELVTHDKEISPDKEKRTAAIKEVSTKVLANTTTYTGLTDAANTQEKIEKTLESKRSKAMGKTIEAAKGKPWLTVAIGAIATAFGMKLAFAQGEEVDPSAPEQEQEPGGWFKKAVGFIVMAAGIAGVVVAGKSFAERHKNKQANAALNATPAIG